MEHLNDTGRCPEILFIDRQFQKRFSAAPVQKTIQELLVRVKQRIYFMRKGKDHVEVRSVDDFDSALVHPEFFLNSLAVWAVPVLAGIIMDFTMSAFRAAAEVISKLTGFAA